jgi:prepilin-type N-terminal cleavage/methylation domain-containing protein
MVLCGSLKNESRGGFTLVELLVVVVILGILVAMLSLRFSDFSTTFREANLDTTLAELRSAVNRYQAEHGAFPGAYDSEGALCPNGGVSGTGKGSKGGKKSFAEQLTMYTNRAGQACSTRNIQFRYGPYIKAPALGEAGMPVKPITNDNKVKVERKGELVLTSKSKKGGWKFDTYSGKLIVDHEDYDDL